MKTKTIYWIITGIVCFMLSFGAVFNVMSTPEAVELISTKLGYPAYLVPLLGVMKILGCIVVVIPGFPRLKEWAYAGLVFDLGGAVYSHIAIGAPASEWAPLFIGIGLLFTSYFLYHKTRNPNTVA
jgi:uncharacterized membrane protein YphA (DoxX/SURF4 family)